MWRGARATIDECKVKRDSKYNILTCKNVNKAEKERDYCPEEKKRMRSSLVVNKWVNVV